MAKFISRMDDDNSCTTTTTVDSIRVDTNSLQKPTQPTPNDDSNSGSMPKLTSRDCKNGKEIDPAICNLTNMSKSTSINDGNRIDSATRDSTSMSQGHSTIYAVNRIKSRLTTKDDSTCGSLPKLISRMDDEESSTTSSTVHPVFQNSTIPNYSNSKFNTNE